ncbi:diguanylate cyclase [Pseudoalteromonas sp. C2R02]|uniref:sensor domain-containing diguanylate cyclase n=1 Tax=Pseudoalteromonas sp. C2R02 TaxID=2841565 RepID=UPI001C0A4A99|nr:diguanylate cyclase [Pseudoalteromonas sp. C2R02]MBU2972208.1 diguanylate cyclase [Pseudoalteromonas sp. C2R02]
MQKTSITPPEQLKKQLRLLENILTNVGAFIYAKDLNGCYVYANQAVLDLFNRPLNEVLGKDDSHFFDLPLSKQLKANDNKVISQGATIENEETNVVKETGQTHIYRTIKKPLFNDSQKIIGMCGISTDITEEKKLQKIIRHQKQLLDTVLDNVDAHIYMKNLQRELLYVNNKTAKLFGYPVDEIIGKKENDILPAEIADHFYQSDKKVFETNEKQVIDEEVIDEEGNQYRYLSIKVPYNREGELPALIGFSSDVTELYQLKEQFKKQANTDPLTELYNRRFFIEQAEKEFNRTCRHSNSLSLISFDIDHFKNINDKYGHPAGDQVLIQLAKALQPVIRNEDILARIGGEEFCLLLPETPIDVANQVAERIRNTLANMTVKGDWQGEISITVSLGVTSLKAKDDSFEQLFKRADKALYNAKNNGRDQVSQFI